MSAEATEIPQSCKPLKNCVAIVIVNDGDSGHASYENIGYVIIDPPVCVRVYFHVINKSRVEVEKDDYFVRSETFTVYHRLCHQFCCQIDVNGEQLHNLDWSILLQNWKIRPAKCCNPVTTLLSLTGEMHNLQALENKSPHNLSRVARLGWQPTTTVKCLSHHQPKNPCDPFKHDVRTNKEAYP